MAVTSSM
jgi:hypothetical protein